MVFVEPSFHFHLSRCYHFIFMEGHFFGINFAKFNRNFLPRNTSLGDFPSNDS
ncbi:unnamed protein product [Meloidogyne enterolobii]|uniref:Uncharacterized protein n=1 Tax=Meloidogyne enterolobii TaxID=390850 RepID=A0ACB1A763_MELEN